MLLLRVTVPIEIYTKPILVEVDGVEIRLKILGIERKPRAPPTTTPEPPTMVPNPMDLAQSFLDTQPSAERKKLEEALAAETQDLGTSVSVSDDGSEDEPTFGTGQSLSLPAFLADYLQGILDRVQVRIRGVKFQLDVEVPADPSSPSPESVSFQVALESINVEGVTTQADEEDGSPAIVPKEGKRHVSLIDIRAYLISEANVFSALARSPSVASPSVASSPAMTRNPPSRETSSLSEGLFRDPPMSSMQQSFRDHMSDPEDPDSPEYPLGDSEEALAIPYEFYEAEDDAEDENPATPRASVYHELGASMDESMFHSTLLPESLSSSVAPEAETHQEQSLEFESTSELPIRPAGVEIERSHTPEVLSTSAPTSDSSGENSTEDLTQSHLYTHEEAESMYMSAFSEANSRPSLQPSLPVLPQLEIQPDSEPSIPTEQPQTPRQTMPGGWGESSESSPISERDVLGDQTSPPMITEEPEGQTDSGGSSPAFSRACLLHQEAEPSRPRSVSQPDDVATPKGPTRLVKEILSLKNMSIYIPSQHKHVHLDDASDSVTQLSQSVLDRSVYPQAPGAFSSNSAMPHTPPPQTTAPEDIDDTLEVVMSPISVHFDASLGVLLAMVVGKLLEAVKGEAPRATTTQDKTPTPKAPNVKLSLQEISLNFLNRLGGVADTPERYLDPSSFNFSEEVLLNATAQNLTVAISQKEIKSSAKGRESSAGQGATETLINLEKFRFGYATGDILSFDSTQPMSTSVRDTFLSAGHAIGVKIIQSADKTRTDIETLPLVVQIELQRLDETFSWFGGLSSFLNMSASMTSSPSPTPRVTPVAQRPRGVRFETPIDPMDRSAASQNKVNLRIGGALVELIGKDCSVAAKSRAIKVVSRDEGIGMACAMIRVSGPYVKNSTADPAISTEIGGVRLDFLMAPNDADLGKLLELITPSKVKFDHANDEIMVGTLLSQRRNGSVLRATVDTMEVRVKNMAQLAALPNLGEEIAKLSTVAKYLPEDDRPGLLTLGAIQKVSVRLEFGGRLGHLAADVNVFEIGHISVPSLVAVAIHGVSVTRNGSEELISSSTFTPRDISGGGPVIMARMIGDEIEPVIKLKLQDLSIDYRVPTIMDILGLDEDATPQDFEESLAASVANLGDQAHTALAGQPLPPTERSKGGKPMTLDIGIRDCLLGLNPLNLPSKLVIALTDSQLEVVLPKDEETKATLSIKKASILLIDDFTKISGGAPPTNTRRRASSSASRQVAEMCAHGFVDICYMSSAKAVVNVTPGPEGDKQVAVELRDDLLVLETCADSTQTLITLTNALKPPTPPSKENKYRTKVVPVQDLLASISAEAFGKPEGEYDFDQDFAGAQELAGSGSDVGFDSDNSLRIESQFYGEHSVGEEMFDAMNSSGLSQGTSMQDTNEGVLLTGYNPAASEASADSDELAIHEDYYHGTSDADHFAKVWNSNRNSYDRAPDHLVKHSPLKVSVRDVHLIWNLFDGYDWEHTRDIITKAVQEVETKAYERQSRGPQVYEEEIEDEETIGDFLFNSIYIGIPANRDPQELSRAINEGLNDNATETESVATTAFTGTTNRTVRPHKPRPKGLRLTRSKHHKITFELQGVNVDMVAFPAGAGETMSSVDVRILNLDVFDHVPTSTWKKFATYDQDKGEREMGTSMVHLELLNVKPLPELGASEIVLRATILPLRLHVDQDALDFIIRFFEFKDEDVPVHSSPSDVPFVQRAEINNVSVKLDFKPKRVDYAGLRSGHTTEFMNFIVLEESRMVLRHVIIYGVTGFDRLGKTLNDIWSPDVRNNQLPGVVAGLAPVRSLVNISSGFRDLVEVPLREYKKDGRVIRSISKGAAAFARTTGTELVKLGAKLAVGTQYALQGAEGMLAEQQQTESGWEEEDSDPEDKKQISLYADQPTGVMQGIRGGYRSLARDVNLARDAIIAVPGEVMQSQSAGGAARAVWKRAPTIIFRPAVGISKVIGQTLMGATNTIDPENKRRIDEVCLIAHGEDDALLTRGRNTRSTEASIFALSVDRRHTSVCTLHISFRSSLDMCGCWTG